MGLLQVLQKETTQRAERFQIWIQILNSLFGSYVMWVWVTKFSNVLFYELLLKNSTIWKILKTENINKGSVNVTSHPNNKNMSLVKEWMKVNSGRIRKQTSKSVPLYILQGIYTRNSFYIIFKVGHGIWYYLDETSMIPLLLLASRTKK